MTMRASPTLHPPPPTSSTPRSASAGSVNPGRLGRQPMILREPAKPAARFGEIAGSTAAECAAICCCFPCGLVGLVVCMVVKLPVGLCRRAYIKRRRRRITALKKKAAVWAPAAGSSFDESDFEILAIKEEWGIPMASPSLEVAATEREMWAQFYETGFWRSPSQREGSVKNLK